MITPRVFRALLIGTALLALPRGGWAQTHNRLTVSGYPLSFGSPTIADFVTGYVDSPNPISFVVDALSGGSIFTFRVATVSIRCASPCPLSGSKAVTDLQWRRADEGTWNPISTSDVMIEQRTMVRTFWNDPWGNDVYWRMLLDYDTDASGTTVTYRLIMTLTMTAP